MIARKIGIEIFSKSSKVMLMRILNVRKLKLKNCERNTSVIKKLKMPKNERKNTRGEKSNPKNTVNNNEKISRKTHLLLRVNLINQQIVTATNIAVVILPEITIWKF
jgi:hypothetical protein